MRRLLWAILLCCGLAACGAPSEVSRARRAHYSGKYEAVWDTLVQAVAARYTLAYANPRHGVIVTCPQDTGITGRNAKGQLVYGTAMIALRLEGGAPYRVRIQKLISTHNASGSSSYMNVRTDDAELRSLSLHVDAALRAFAIEQTAAHELGVEQNVVTFARGRSMEACPSP